MIVWSVFLISVVWTLTFWYRRRNMYKLASVIPGPKEELPVIGVAHTLVGNTEEIMNQLQHYSYVSMQNNGIMKGWLGHILYFILVHPADLEVVLKSCLEKDDLHRFIRKVTGYGGIFAPGLSHNDATTAFVCFRTITMELVADWKLMDRVMMIQETEMSLLSAEHMAVTAGELITNFRKICGFVDLTSRRMSRISSAKLLLIQSLGKVDQSQEHRGKKSVQDIMAMLTTGDPDDVPGFLPDDALGLYFSQVGCGQQGLGDSKPILSFVKEVNSVSIWRRRRKVIVPAFSPKIVENFVSVFAEQSHKLVKQLKKYSGKGKFCIWPFLTSYTLDSVCETTVGEKLNAQENPDSPFLNALGNVLNLICERIFHLWLQPDWMYRLFPRYKKHQSCINVLHDFTDKVIEMKRKELKLEKESKTEVDHEYDLGSYKSKTFLDVLIQLSGEENGYTNVELREELLTLMVAGTDTSAVAIGYTLILLSKYPEVQERVYQELCDVFGNDRLLVKEDLTKLKYLERVVKESLRLFPPVPLIIRKVLEDIKLPSGRVLPAGSGVVCSIWGVHRDPKYWGPDAEKFDPDRFLPERFKLAHPCSYMPFSNGPRNCIGYQYALMSIKTALSTILRNYKVVGDREIGPTPNIRVKLDIMMKAVDGYQVVLERRKSVPT